MTKTDIYDQGGNPNYIEQICHAIIREVNKPEFSLEYIKETIVLLEKFTGELVERS